MAPCWEVGPRLRWWAGGPGAYCHAHTSGTSFDSFRAQRWLHQGMSDGAPRCALLHAAADFFEVAFTRAFVFHPITILLSSVEGCEGPSTHAVGGGEMGQGKGGQGFECMGNLGAAPRWLPEGLPPGSSRRAGGSPGRGGAWAPQTAPRRGGGWQARHCSFALTYPACVWCWHRVFWF
jgi:hypothetical protein